MAGDTRRLTTTSCQSRREVWNRDFRAVAVSERRVALTAADVRAYRVRAQQLDRESGSLTGTAILDIGVQDTGPDGALWALAIRGVDVSGLEGDQLCTAWTVRGAPHAYRRADMPSVAAAVAPFSDADAGKRIFDASKPLKAAGISNLQALDAVAATMRSVAVQPTVKGDMSGALTRLLDSPYLRFCRPCNATHAYEQTFRIAALRGGLELQAGTSPPVLQRIPNFTVASKPAPQHDVIRAYLRLLGPSTPKNVADYLDAPVKDVKQRWPDDAVEVSVDGEARWVLVQDESDLAPEKPEGARLLGPFDLFLQAKDRATLIDDPAHAKAMWPVIGRPGAVLLDGDVVGMWRPRKSGKKLTVQVEPWTTPLAAARTAITGQAEKLAAFRDVSLTTVDFGS